MNKNLFVCIVFLAGCLLLRAEERVRPVNAALWKNLSTDSLGEVDAHTVSINLLSVSQAALQGVSMSILADARTQSSGAQFSGGANVVSTRVQGVQCAVGANIATASMSGAQMSLYNQARQMWGTQMGVVNNTATGIGTQWGVLNMGRDTMRGLQLGVVNIAGQVHGMQLGLINIANSNNDIAVGLINIIKNGYYRHSVWVDEQGVPFYGFRHGTHRLFMEISAGVQQAEDPVCWMAGAAFGSFIYSGIVNIDASVGSYTINDDTLWQTHQLNQLNQAKVNVAVELFDSFELVAGVSYNCFVSDTSNGEDYYGSQKVYVYDGTNTFVRAWVGGMIGCRF